MTQTLSREIPLVPSQSALLFIDVQNFAAKREGAEFRDIPDDEFQAKYGWYFRELSARVVPNMQRTGYEAAALLDEMMAGKIAKGETHLIPPVGIATDRKSVV